MRYTNKHNLPPAVFKALTQDNYNAGESDYSCTTLLKPPRIVQLTRRHDDEIIKDAMDMLWSSLGTAVHNMFEANVEEGAVAEVRMYIDSLKKKIGGQLDHYKDGVISDYKCTSVWSWIFGSRVKEWAEQQNIYAAIYRKNGFTVKTLQIIAVFRDWKESEFLRNPQQYPPLPIMIINLEVWPEGNTKPFIDYRTQLQIDAETLSDDELPLCTEQEMWAMPTKYAVMKNKNKTASRVLLSLEDAKEWIINAELKAKKPATYKVVVREGKRNRCAKYCDASEFCNVYQAWLKEQENKDES